MTLLQEVTEKCQLAMSGLDQTISIAGPKHVDPRTVRLYVSAFNGKNGTGLRVTVDYNRLKSAIIYRQKTVDEMGLPGFEVPFVPHKLAAFVNGGNYTQQDVDEIKVFSQKLAIMLTARDRQIEGNDVESLI